MAPVARCILSVLLLFAAPWAFAGEARVSRAVDVGYFDRLDISGAVRVTIEPGNTPWARVTAAESVMSAVRVERSGETLHLGWQGDNLTWLKPWDWFDNHDVLFEVRLPALKALTVSGASDVVLADMRSGELDLNVSGASKIRAGNVVFESVKAQLSGAADIDIEALEAGEVAWRVWGSSNTGFDRLKARALAVDAAGASDFQVFGSGSVQSLIVNVAGAAGYYGHKLKADEAVVKAVGASRAEVHAARSLKAESIGASNVEYSGNPVGVEIGASGVAAVH